MNQFVMLGSIGADLAQMGKDTAEKFGVDWPHFIAQLISFLVVAALLYKFAYRRVLAVLEQRRQLIADSQANVEKIKAELAKTEAARREVMSQANEQANKLIEEARAAAARVQEQQTQKAIAVAEQIMAKARQAAAADHARMMAELRREMGRLVVQTTATVTGRILTPDDQRRLAEETNRQLTATSGSQTK